MKLLTFAWTTGAPRDVEHAELTVADGQVRAYVTGLEAAARDQGFSFAVYDVGAHPWASLRCYDAATGDAGTCCGRPECTTPAGVIPPADLTALEHERRGNFGRNAYRRQQAERLGRGEPLLPEYDRMTAGERAAAGLLDGYDPEAVPAGVHPDAWADARRAQLRYEGHVPGEAERARGYDTYGRGC